MLVFFLTSDHVSLPCGVFLFPAYHVGCFYSRPTMWGVFIPEVLLLIFPTFLPCGVFLFPRDHVLDHVGCFYSRSGTMCLTMWGVFIPGSPCGL